MGQDFWLEMDSRPAKVAIKRRTLSKLKCPQKRYRNGYEKWLLHCFVQCSHNGSGTVKAMMKNATIDPTPLTPNEQLLSVVDTHNIKIILVGGPGVGKSLVAAKIMTALSAIMPDTEISLRETDQLPSETIKQVQMVDTVLPSLSKRVKKISIYTMQTNKSGVLKGVSRIVDKQDKP